MLLFPLKMKSPFWPGKVEHGVGATRLRRYDYIDYRLEPFINIKSHQLSLYFKPMLIHYFSSMELETFSLKGGIESGSDHYL